VNKPSRSQLWLKTLMGAGGGVAVAAGAAILLHYEQAAGASGTALRDLPQETTIARRDGQYTLVMLIHPRCPCSRASLGELAELMAHVQGKVVATALFVKPAGAPEGWEKGDLWSSAAAIPGVTPVCDLDGAEAGRFSAETSGDTVLFSPQGKVLFRGGITGSRGHAGENPGHSSIAALLEGGSPLASQTPVFGCSLFSSRN
jgi:hypothetical protein